MKVCKRDEKPEVAGRSPVVVIDKVFDICSRRYDNRTEALTASVRLSFCATQVGYVFECPVCGLGGSPRVFLLRNRSKRRKTGIEKKQKRARSRGAGTSKVESERKQQLIRP